jgi:hypothetical protein
MGQQGEAADVGVAGCDLGLAQPVAGRVAVEVLARVDAGIPVGRRIAQRRYIIGISAGMGQRAQGKSRSKGCGKKAISSWSIGNRNIVEEKIRG